jgi:ubiquinone/menaquinone biosynthesis C-methylase UbiE
MVGIDPAKEMINLAKKKGLNVSVDGFLDLNKLSLEKNYFDLIISVSALQWVISNKEEMEIKNIIKKIGKDMFNLLSKTGVCVIQFYPKDENIFEIVASAFERCNFNVSKFIYNEKSIKKRKFILILNK